MSRSDNKLFDGLTLSVKKSTYLSPVLRLSSKGYNANVYRIAPFEDLSIKFEVQGLNSFFFTPRVSPLNDLSLICLG